MSVIALVLAIAIGAEPTPPDPAPSPSLARARLCWAAVDAECAEAALAEARAMLGDLVPEDQIAVLVLSAEVALSSDQPDVARVHLVAALERDPRLAPPWPEAWLAALEEARRAMPDRLPPTIRADLPVTTLPRRPLLVKVHAADPSGVARVTVQAAGRDFVCVTADGELWQVELPAEVVKIPDISLTIVAADRAGNVETRGEVVAVVLPPRPPDDEPAITSRWWFWTAIGVGVAAIATTAVLLTAGDDATASPAGDGALLLTVEVDTEPFE